MLWIGNNTHGHTSALDGHVRGSTRNMTFVAAGAAVLQTLVELTYIFWL